MTMKELRALVPEVDIQLARMTQAAQRAAGVPVQSLAVICNVAKPRVRDMRREFTERLLEGRNDLEQAALLIDQAALAARTRKSANRLRSASQTIKEVDRASQIEFDFFEGNMSTAFEFMDAITARLRQSGQSLARQHQALSVLWTICRHLGWQTYECTKTAADLCDITGDDAANMARTLQLLEDVGAITRVKKGRHKVITVSPEGAYYGDIRQHRQAVDRYKLEVIDGGKRDDPSPAA